MICRVRFLQVIVLINSAFDKLRGLTFEASIMLNNDFSLPISFSLAAQIGLEETVLLTFLRQQAYLLNDSVIKVDIAQLSAQLPFWTVPMVMRLLANLQLSQLLNFQRQDQALEIWLSANQKPESEARPTSSVDTSDVLMSKMSRLHQEAREKPKAAPAQPQFTPKQSAQAASNPYGNRPASRAQEFTQNVPAVNDRDRRGKTDFDLYLEQKERARQPDQWQPEEATLEQITQAGIAREFALSLQAEFLLRIKEQRKNVRTWNSEFFKYVKRQWQYKQSDRSSYEGTSSSSKFDKTSREQVSDALTNIHDTDW